MQNNSNYFEVTIRNKYDTWTTKRKGLKIKVVSGCIMLLICSSMIFSKNVSSTSEVASEDIRWESEIFPTSSPLAYGGSSIDLVTSSPEPTPSTTKRDDMMSENIIPKTRNMKSSSEKIVSVTNKSSEIQNMKLLKPTETFTTGYSEEKGIIVDSGEVLLTPSPMPSVDSLSFSVTYPPNMNQADSTFEIPPSEETSDEDEVNTEEENNKKEEKEKEEKHKKQKKSYHWKRGGKSGNPESFDDVNNKKSMYKKAKSIWKHLKSAGYSDGAAAGVLGNIEQESGFNIYSSTGQYKGLFQLSINDRFRNSINWCEENGYLPYSIEGQVRFMLEENG